MNANVVKTSVRKVLASYHLWRAGRLQRRHFHASAHRKFASAAKLGDINSSYMLGLNYSQGRGCLRSGSEALYWYSIAAAAGHRDAQFELGVALLNDHDAGWCAGSSAKWAEACIENGGSSTDLIFPNGLKVYKDAQQAFHWLYESALAGKAEAQANLGWLLLKGLGCAQDFAEAHRWFVDADRHDISQASLGLAEIFGNKSSGFYDLVKQRIWLTRSADLENPSAAYQLGLLLRAEVPSHSSLKDAERYLAFAASRSHPAASYELGLLQISRSSTDFDIERAVNHLRTAAKRGHVQASVYLGELYSRGDRFKPDMREAAHWFRRAADAGHVQAQFLIGCLFARGEGVPKDLKHAAKYFELSAAAGHPTAAFNVSVFYEKGEGVREDLEKSIEYLKMASEKGVSQAQLRLAHLLNSGKVGTPNKQAAAHLIKLAAEQNNPDAEVALAFLLMEERNDVYLNQIEELLARAIDKGHMGAAELMLARPVTSIGQRAAKAAVALINDAAECGSLRAMVLLASELLSGRYMSPDPIRAERILNFAADAQDPVGNFDLGVFYCKRNRDASDLEKGFSYYVKAADLGHALAKFNAGVMLLNGVGVSKDLQRATDFFVEAANQGVAQAREVLGKISTN